MAGKLNPQIKTVEVGVKTLKEVTIYPLSLADQFKASDLVLEMINLFSSMGESDEKFMLEALTVLKKNAETIFDMISDEGALVMDDLTNNQLVEIAQILYDVNFKEISKNLKSLLDRQRQTEDEMNQPQSE